MNNKNIQFLKDKYGLHKDEGVHNTANRSNKLQGTNISTSNIKESIGNFLKRYDEVLKNKDINPQSFEALKKLIFQENIIKPENIPNSYWEFQKRVIVNQGRGGELSNGEIPKQAKKSEVERILKEQKTSLGSWINYLSDPTCPYDVSMKYFILKNIITVDSDFGKRSNSTVKNFPELNQEYLARTMDLIQKSIINREKIELENKDLEKFAKNKNFVKIYEFFVNEAKLDNNILENTKGEWKKYDRKSDHMALVKSLEGKNTGWCTAGEETAEKQLSEGDFYVYYSQDKDGNNTLPRVAIRMEGEEIAEIRGILPGQEMDKYILPVLSKKLEEFGDKAEEYKEKERDMFFLTAITEKLDNGEKLTEEEMRFLFQIDKNIKNFGYTDDPRIEENIRKLKDNDLLNLFGSIQEIKGALDLSKLTSLPENFKFPESIGGALDLSKLTSLPENFKFPENIGGYLYLFGLTSLPENIKFPENIGGYLNLSKLTSLPENIKFPENIGRSLDLSGLTSLPENFKFPENIGGYLGLSGLTRLPENIKFPENIGGYLGLSGLTSLPENIKFPENFRGKLDLSGLTSLPENIDFLIKFNGKLILNLSLKEEF